MCGRYDFGEIEGSIKILERAKALHPGADVRTGEIFPTNLAPIVRLAGGKVQPDLCRWGYPKWKGSGVIINARAETAEEKRTFRESLLQRRCVIPTTGFYEWSHDEAHQKYLFKLPGEGMLYLAGFWGDFQGEGRFCILTREANRSMADIHDRMPLVLQTGQVRRWVQDIDFAHQYLQAALPELSRTAV